MAEPRNQMPAAAGCEHLRASHADREQVIGTLKAAYVQGMLAKDEFDLRVSQAFASRIYADLAVLIADIPAGLAVTQAPKPALVQPPPPSVADGKAAARMIATATAIPAGLWAFVFLAPDRYVEGGGSFLLLLVTSSTLIWLLVLLLVGVDMHISRQERRSGGKLTRGPGPGAGGQASQRPASAGPEEQFRSARDHPRHAAEAAPSRRPRPLLPVWRARLSMSCVR